MAGYFLKARSRSESGSIAIRPRNKGNKTHQYPPGQCCRKRPRLGNAVMADAIFPDYQWRPFLEQVTETMLRVSLSNALLMGLIVHFSLAGVALIATL